ncbi:hypothetical protein [Alteromonas oceanisediminis]|uniref:hypothetical protein n=1 Tax=Alteromonas oceanisediminis TaxID=2836180 RepID=UPI001BDABC05|nr:hypothetical protein [Alteromonas oceanisediminis]MBT0585742.1 hypothetical protein [Alteromonas oceanisediminis]
MLTQFSSVWTTLSQAGWFRFACTSLLLSLPYRVDAALDYTESKLPPASIFSSYSSEKVLQPCAQQANGTRVSDCVEDFIEPSLFLEQIRADAIFSEAAASADGYDYEVLIANVLVKPNATLVTEIDVTWRNIPLGHYIYQHDDVSEQADANIKRSLAGDAIAQFMLDVQRDAIFTARHLFTVLNASDYPKDLKLPQAIGQFSLYDMQLYHDPLKGAVARYTNPQFEREVLDIFVYPIFSQHASTSLDAAQRLDNELARDISDIQVVANARNIDDIDIGRVRTIDWHIGNTVYQGAFFDVEAQDEQGEPLYTSTYLFESKDKFIKFSANFPARIADDMVKNALPQITVPDASQMMQTLRHIDG